MASAVLGRVKHSVQAITPAPLCVLQGRDFSDLFAGHPALPLNGLQTRVEEEQWMDVRLSPLGRSTAEQRIAHLMLETFDRLRQRAGSTEARPAPSHCSGAIWPMRPVCRGCTSRAPARRDPKRHARHFRSTQADGACRVRPAGDGGGPKSTSVTAADIRRGDYRDRSVPDLSKVLAISASTLVNRNGLGKKGKGYSERVSMYWGEPLVRIVRMPKLAAWSASEFPCSPLMTQSINARSTASLARRTRARSADDAEVTRWPSVARNSDTTICTPASSSTSRICVM